MVISSIPQLAGSRPEPAPAAARAASAPAPCFHASKLPLTKWFQAIYLVTQNKSNIYALSLKRSLGVCYRTAWRVKHKLLEAMAERESYRLLTGMVPADDAVLGGVHPGKPGRGSQNKAPFVAAVELNDEGHPLHVRFDPITDLKGSTLADWARTALHEGVHLVTDGCASFNAAGAAVGSAGQWRPLCVVVQSAKRRTPSGGTGGNQSAGEDPFLPARL